MESKSTILILGFFLIFHLSCDSFKNSDGNKNHNSEHGAVEEVPNEGHSDTSNQPSNAIVKSLDLGRFESLVIIDSTPSEGVVPEQIYGVGNSGSLEIVNLFEDSNNEQTLSLLKNSPNYKAHGIINSKDAVYFLIDSPACNVVATQKKAGDTFCIHHNSALNIEQLKHVYTGNRAYIQQFGPNSVIFLAPNDDGGSSLLQLDYSNPDSLEKRDVFSHPWPGIHGYVINNRGDIFVSIQNSGGAKIIKKGGGLQNVAPAGAFNGFVAKDDSFLFVKNGSTDIFRLSVDSNGVYNEAVHKLNTVDQGLGGNHWTSHVCEVQDEIFVVYPELAGFYRLDKIPSSIDSSSEGFQVIDGLICSPSTVYLLGRDSVGDSMIKSFNPVDSNWTTLLQPGSFTIFTFDTDSDGKIYFNGLRNSDGIRVYGSIRPSDSAPEVISQFFPKTSTLKPLK